MNAVTRFLGLASEPSATPAADALRVAAERLKSLRAEAATVAARARPFDHAAAIAAPTARAELAELERLHVEAEATHALNGTLDHDRPDRVAEIDKAHRRLAEAERAAVIGKAATVQNEAALRPYRDRIAATERELPGLERAALLEALDAAAIEHKVAFDVFLESTRRCFALAHAATARGAVAGAGLEVHLVMPHPELPAFKGCEIPRTFRLEVQAEAQRILEGLRA